MRIRLTERAHQIVRGHVEAGDLVIDATAGNGHDTVFLAELVGPTGRVVAYDVQPSAIESTRRRLKEAGLCDRVALQLESHERIGMLPDDAPAAAVMFNLGYLPGAADKDLITRPASTCSAIRAANRILKPGGVITVLCYIGHEGGRDEAEAVCALVSELDPKRFRVLGHEQEGAGSVAPRLITIERLDGAR